MAYCAASKGETSRVRTNADSLFPGLGGGYVGLPNHARNGRHLGYAVDVIDRRSDVIDGLFAIGDAEVTTQRVSDQFAAGTDHLCIQVMADPGPGIPLEAWRALAPASRP